MSFSERHHYVIRSIQTDRIDTATRNLLWNVVEGSIFRFSKNAESSRNGILNQQSNAVTFYIRIWVLFFKEKRKDIPFFANEYGPSIIRYCEEFLDKCEWFKFYDFIEFIISEFHIFHKDYYYKENKDSFITHINNVLDKEKCAYRLIDRLIIPVTNEGEVMAIQKGLDDTNGITTVNSHLTQSLKLFSDREQPDYRNSIKESISAIEALVKLIIRDEKATLGDGIKRLKSNNVHIHDALIKSISGLYGWTSDENGVRHGHKSGSNIDIEDAQFSLVICCSVASYLIQKATKAELSLN